MIGKYIVDRFEGDKAVLVSGKGQIIVPKKLLPGAKEGDLVDGNLKVKTNEKDRKKVKKLLEEVLEEK